MSELRVDVIPARELGAAEATAWARVQEADPALANPFFRPEFTEVVAAVREDAYVALLERDGARGWFAFQRRRRRVGVPIGGGRSNYQGVVADPSLRWDAAALLRGCGLAVYDFDHLLVDQRQFARFHDALDVSPVMDLDGGFAAYAARSEAGGSKVVKKMRQQERRIEREIGPLRFVAHDPEPAMLSTMMRWKSQQYRDTGSPDRFAERWNVELMERIAAARATAFQGMLSTLWAGDRLAAVSMSMRSRHVFHYWFPTYDRELATYSPGMLLMLKLAEQADGLGLTLLDLGRGRSPYKDRLATSAITIAEGIARVPSATATVAITRAAAARAIRGSALRAPARIARRALRPPERRA